MRWMLVLALLAAAPAWAKPPKKPVEKEKPTVSDAAAPTKKEAKQRSVAFAEYDAQMASGQKARAADALVVILDNADLADWHGEAYARFGDILADSDLSYAALCAYTRAFSTATDLTIEEVSLRVPAAIGLAEKVGDVAILEKPFSTNLGLARTEDVRGKMAYLAARENLRRQNYGVATAMLKLVKQGDPLYPEAKSLEGVILNQQARTEDALKAFEAAQKSGTDREVRFQDTLQLNTARTWYGAGNYPRAIEAFSRVSRSSEFWPEAQFERAWAHFRIDDINGALAQLFSLDTPFFEKYYFPEADLLRIYSFFLLCKFPEAEAEIEIFKNRYTSVDGKLKAWGEKSVEENFQTVRKYKEKGDTAGLPEMIWRPYAAEERLSASIKAVDSAEDELKRMRNVSANPFTERARSWLDERRKFLVDTEGGRVKDRIAAQEAEIGGMLGDSEIFVLDILRMKTQLYEQAALTGRMPDAARTVVRKDRLRRGYREWPFQGEIWADELGYYRIDVIPECPANMRQGVAGKP